MTKIIYSLNETPAFRHFFHYYYFVSEGSRLMPPDQQEAMGTFFEAEVIAFDYKEYRKNGIPGMAGNDLAVLPSSC